MSDVGHDGEDNVGGPFPPDLGHVLGHPVHGGILADCDKVALMKLQQGKQLMSFRLLSKMGLLL